MILLNFVAIQAVRVPAAKQVIARPIHRERQIIADIIRNDRRLHRRNAHMLGIDSEVVSYEELPAMTDQKILAALSNEEFVRYAMAMAKPVLESINQHLKAGSAPI